MRRFPVLVALATFLSAAAVHAVRTQPLTIASIGYEGLRHVPEEVVRGAQRLRPGQSFDAARLEDSRRALAALGYFRSVAASRRVEEDQAHLTYRFAELPRVAHLRVLGNSVVDQESIRGVITTRLGQVLCGPQLQNDIRSIERLYRDRGYVVRISEKLLDEAARSGILRFELLEVRIAEVTLEGLEDSLRRRAREGLHELPPALYRPEAVAIDQLRLLRVPGIRGALPVAETTVPGRVRIRWILTAS